MIGHEINRVRGLIVALIGYSVMFVIHT